MNAILTPNQFIHDSNFDSSANYDDLSDGSNYENIEIDPKVLQQKKKEFSFNDSNLISISDSILINKIGTNLIYDVNRLFNEVFDIKIPQKEIQTFLKTLLMIIRNQTLNIINQSEISYDNYPACQAFPTNELAFPYPINNNYFSSIIPNFYQNYYMQPFINSNFYIQQTPTVNQQIYTQPEAAKKKKSKSDKNSKKKKGKDVKTKKSDKKSKKSEKKKEKGVKIKKSDKQKLQSKEKVAPATVESFNVLPLKLQQSIISEIIQMRPNTDSKSVLSKINNLLLYLLQFGSLSEERCFSIQTNSNESFIEEALLNLKEIQISDPAIEKMIGTGQFDDLRFTDVLRNFDRSLIKLKYPSSSFSGYFDRILNVRRQLKGQTFIVIVISGIAKTGSFFAQNSNIDSIEIDSTVTEIGKLSNFGSSEKDGAFSSCTMLTKVTIPSSVTAIGNGSFYQCSSLRRIDLPSSLVTIGDFAFSSCTSLSEVVIPSSVTSLGRSCFSKCCSLRFVSLPPSITRIPRSSFYQCRSLQRVEIPSSVTRIEYRAFFECTALAQVRMPSSVTSIEEGSFSGCSSLDNVLIPSSVTCIEKSAFSKCSSLTSVALSPHLTSIARSVFYQCRRLRDIEIPSSVVSIGYHSFFECSSLTRISIPSSVNEISNNAFEGCSSLQQVQLPAALSNQQIGVNSSVEIISI